MCRSEHDNRMHFRSRQVRALRFFVSVNSVLACGLWSCPVLAQDGSSQVATEVAPAVQPPPRQEDTSGLPTQAEQLPTDPAAPIVVTVQRARTEAELVQQSAEAVNVVDLRKARDQSADLGEVLARTQGVSVRRNGGLGSSSRMSLNGLGNDQIRFFLDGVPLDLAGYPFGIANVPVNLVQHVEVYRGVVPIRLGADALGGAVNLVSDQTYEQHLAASYQVGSFGTHRITLDGRYRHEPSGLIAGGAAFFDTTANNYKIDVKIPDRTGRERAATVRRFHDGYRAYGATLEAGVVDRPWAKRLLLRGYYSGYDKDLQHNVTMVVPYGEVEYGETSYGATGRYAVALQPALELELVASYAHRTIDFVDKSKWIYDWRGQRIGERSGRGEIRMPPVDQSVWQHSAFGRAVVSWTLARGHVLRASLTPNFSTRTGDERLQPDPTSRDPLGARRNLFTLVSGLAYDLDLFDERLSNSAFIKDYYYQAASVERLPGNVDYNNDVVDHSLGVGDALRFRVTPWLYVKGSYELATRLPRPDEVFGNGVLIQANLELKPELSHNANFGPRLELRRTPAGDFTVDTNVFVRESDRLIVLLGNDQFFAYNNVYKARAVGVENSLNWMSPGRYVMIDGMLTWQDVRNASTDGTLAEFKGDRIPNRPYLFGSWGARMRFAKLPSARDTLEPFYNGRYVHSFFRSWESLGNPELKDVVATQVTHSLGVSWILIRDYARLATTFEVDNVSDAKVYDNFGVQRPGRAFYVKVSGELR